jgi:hypothetical protein
MESFWKGINRRWEGKERKLRGEEYRSMPHTHTHTQRQHNETHQILLIKGGRRKGKWE